MAPPVETPQPPSPERDKQVRDDHPDMNELLITKDLDRELERKGNCKEAQNARKNRLCGLVAKTSANAINNHLKPKVNPKYLATFATVGCSTV